MDGASRGAHIRAETLVVFHISAGQLFGCRVIEFSKQVRGQLAHGVHNDVQASTVGHANHHLLHAHHTGLVDELVNAHDETLATLQGKTLLPHILCVQKPLQAFGRSEFFQNAFLFVGIEIGLGANALQLLLPPPLVVLVGHVVELGTNGAAVGFSQCVEQFSERHAIATKKGIARVKHRLLVGIAEAIKRWAELRNFTALSAF